VKRDYSGRCRERWVQQDQNRSTASKGIKGGGSSRERSLKVGPDHPHLTLGSSVASLVGLCFRPSSLTDLCVDSDDETDDEELGRPSITLLCSMSCSGAAVAAEVVGSSSHERVNLVSRIFSYVSFLCYPFCSLCTN
jgi:hypothetical protein